jgi:sporulation protein YlmC with PRC-barrel domain
VAQDHIAGTVSLICGPGVWHHNVGETALAVESELRAKTHRCTGKTMTIQDPTMQLKTGSTDAHTVTGGVGDGPHADVMAASTLDDTRVISADGEHVGKISDIMLDVQSGRVAYVVLAEGGFLGIYCTLHAIPWSALMLDADEKCFFVDMTAEEIRNEPGFDKDHWPSMADAQWGATVHQYYNRAVLVCCPHGSRKQRPH